jgi:diaminopimelate epimerase
MTLFAFDKYEGLGNDFVVVDAASEGDVSVTTARAWCDRRRGVGADGVLEMLPSRTAGAEARMRVLNADGSIAEMCGNGLRCAALHLARNGRIAERRVTIETDAGPRACVVDRDGDDAIVVADMGVVRVLEDLVVSIDDVPIALSRVDAGNPHAVAFRDVERAELERLGPRVSASRAFPGGTNVEFARVASGGIDVLVWERGAGPTLACGTGACAVAAVAYAKGLVQGDALSVRLPGGELVVSHDRQSGRTSLRGAARRVFSGTVPSA